MKVLSLTEPYATLIKEKKKWIETRSWKTDYRGELYIHASSTKIPKNWKDNTELFTLIENIPLNFGNIICKCNLVDCIHMTKEYVENIKEKNHQEYICGDYREGRYAWILDNITPILPIKATGSLNIWNYYTEKEIMSFLEQIEYGWVDTEKKKHLIIDETFSKKYRLQSPKEIIENKIGVCWDQVELERYYFKGYQNIKTYFIVHYDNDKYPTHTFLTIQKDNKYYWFEHAWAKWKGIHEYPSLEELLRDVKEKFILDELKNNYNKNNLCLYEYKKPKSNITVEEYYKHCEQGKKMTTMKLQPNYYNYMLHGTKRIEIRVYDEKRKNLNLGETITFLKEPDLKESFQAKIIGLLRYENFDELFQDFDISILADKSITKETLKKELEQF